MDRLLRKELREEFRKAMTELNERYVKAETLCQHVEVLTVDWLKRHGSCFNRTKVCYTDKSGVRHDDGPWLYPLHEIIEMMHDGRIKELIEK